MIVNWPRSIEALWALDLLGEAGFDPVYGARPLKRTIQRHVDNLLSTAILRGDIKPGDSVTFDVGDTSPFEIKLATKQE